VFAVERLESIDDVARRVRSASAAAFVSPTIHSVKSTEASRGYSVRQEVEALPQKYEAGHVVAICSHAALLMSDFTNFHGWHLVVDEVPGVLHSEEIASKCDVEFFARHYELTPVDQKWSSVTLTDQGLAIDGSDLAMDDSHRHLRAFHQRVVEASRGGDTVRSVICNLQSWPEMAQDNLKWVWWSVFSIHQLEAFRSIKFLGNAFTQSLSYKILRKRANLQPGDNRRPVQWKSFSKNRVRAFAKRNVHVRYFATRNAACSHFATDVGLRHRKQIGEYVASQVAAEHMIWTCNKLKDVVADPLFEALPATSYLRPRQAGTDAYMDRSHALIIYASKPSRNMRSVLDHLRLDDSDWVISNEYETILQFVTRTSVRDPANAQDVTIWVYNKDQATYLMDYLATLRHVTADIDLIDLGLVFEASNPGGRPKISRTPDEAAALAQEQRDRKARTERERRKKLKEARFVAGQPLRPRGRPRKAA
ncbi:hypothetical protein SAMN05444678_13012, partial [Sphingomonas sp. YR710]|uniref:hypothetical protein n=1 Tax=Sphingomonas sp. YR710 TaxID=1882773 RepID=UPI000881776A